jgi:2-amino-4-hydroxy-6-hydroxymethyldihydropteridine diphosphokinase
MRSSVKSVLALGGNLGERETTIAQAINELDSHKKIQVIRQSPLIESAALTETGFDETKPNYLNGVVEIRTSLTPKKLLKFIGEVENTHGRIRVERWGSRTLDIDIITYGNVFKAGKKLTIPHPRAHQRAFVLVPWSMMDSDAILPGHGAVSSLASGMEAEVWLPK